MRPSERLFNQMRPVNIETGVSKYAEGSCVIKFGETHVLCTASVEEKVPPFLLNSGRGWITAEYNMLPRATNSRSNRRRIAQSGRTQEIQRLIGRSLRAITNLDGFGELQIIVDCDVLQADGGTRTASITGGYVALQLAFQHLQSIGIVNEIPTNSQVAAVSCGIWRGKSILDLDYSEDSTADADANFVLTADGKIIEIQGTAEKNPFEREKFDEMLELATKGVDELCVIQKKALQT
ncbi:MAG: ribonuclease PH [Rhodospirillaceae bacterium]|nr:ribonuclease PH [Rhodospirillaceae bacterium]|tara:strand:- start:1312 stop:2022 length:711 start_codon:yes stop_codon:yes gene_type:complete